MKLKNPSWVGVLYFETAQGSTHYIYDTSWNLFFPFDAHLKYLAKIACIFCLAWMKAFVLKIQRCSKFRMRIYFADGILYGWVPLALNHTKWDGPSFLVFDSVDLWHACNGCLNCHQCLWVSESFPTGIFPSAMNSNLL